MARRAPAFSIDYCNYEIRKQRESTARIAIWREFGIERSYTLESSYCGCDRGPYKGLSLGINHLLEVGHNLCEAIDEMDNPIKSSASVWRIPNLAQVADTESENGSNGNLAAEYTCKKFKTHIYLQIIRSYLFQH